LRKFWELTKLFKLIPTQKFRTFELTFHKLQEKDSQSKDLGQSLKNYILPSKYAITLEIEEFEKLERKKHVKLIKSYQLI
jgi:hypothetical protein